MKLKPIIVLHTVDDRQIPTFDGIHVSMEWDGFQVDEILELEHGKPDRNNWAKHRDLVEPIKKRMFDTWKQIHKEHYIFADWDDEPDANYYAIYFYPLSFPGIHKYLEHFADYLINDCWTGRGADDDYFDYLPSITDIFYQLCKHYEQEFE